MERKVQIKLTNKQVDLIRTGSHVMTNGNSYYFLPFWFKQTDKKNIFELCYLDHLPDELTKVINWSRKKESDLKFSERIYYASRLYQRGVFEPLTAESKKQEDEYVQHFVKKEKERNA